MDITTKTDRLRAAEVIVEGHGIEAPEATQMMIQATLALVKKDIEEHDPNCDCKSLKFLKEYQEAVQKVAAGILREVAN